MHTWANGQPAPNNKPLWCGVLTVVLAGVLGDALVQQGLRVGVHAQHAQLVIHQPLCPSPPLSTPLLLRQGGLHAQCRQDARRQNAFRQQHSIATALATPPLGQPQCAGSRAQPPRRLSLPCPLGLPCCCSQQYTA